MSQQVGRLLAIKVGDGASPNEAFSFGCGFTTQQFQINNNMVDITTPDCANPANIPKEKLTYGIQSIQFTGSGKADNAASNLGFHNAARQQLTKNYQIIVPGWGMFQGPFLIESLNLSGEQEGNMDFEATFRCADGTAIIFTAE